MKILFTLHLCFVSCFVCSCLFAQPFAKEYHTGTGTTWQVIKPTADNNLIAVGDYTADSTSPNIIMVTKLSVDGTVLWSKTFGDGIQQNGLNITETTDGDFVVAGIEFVYDIFTSEFTATGCLIKVTKNGTLRWNKHITYGNRNYFLLTHVAATPDGGVIAGGNFEQFSSGSTASFDYLAKVDTNGNMVWQKQLDTKSNRRWIADLFCTQQIVTVVSESSIGNGNNAKDAAAITLLNESDGAVIQSKQFRLPDANIHFIQAAAATTTGDGIVVSGTAGKGIGDFDIWTFKVDNKLNLLWSNVVARGDDDRPNKVSGDADGNIIIGGTSSGSDGFFRSYILWLDNADGKMIKNQWLDEASRGVFGMASVGSYTYALSNQQFGTGSNPYTSLYAWTGTAGACTQSTLSGTWQDATGVTTDNRKLPAVNIAAIVSEMNAAAAGASITVSNLCSVLPLQLLSFSGDYQNRHTVLNWQTATETNTSFFTAERSIDNGLHYTKVGMVTAAGTGNNRYSFVDNTTPAGRVLYRLAITEKDGKESYSQTIEVNTLSAKAVVYPNPVQHEMHIAVTLPQTTSVQATVINLLGQTVMVQPMPANAGMLTKTIDVSKLPAGIYFVKITGAGINETLRFTKQ